MANYVFGERVVFFNNLPLEEQNVFLNFLSNTGIDIDGDVVYLPKSKRLQTLKKLFPSEGKFKSNEKVIVRGVLYMLEKPIMMGIIFPPHRF